MSQSRRILRRIALLLASILVAVLVVEVLLRIVDPFSTGELIARQEFERTILEPHPSPDIAGNILRAGVSTEFLGHEVVLSDQRMRNAAVRADKPQGTYRVVVAGDSIAFGWGVAESESFPRVLEAKLNSGPKPAGVDRFEVVNGGVPGFGIPGYFLYLRDTGLPLAPDLVIVTFINNDLTDIIKVLEGDQAQPEELMSLPGWASGLYTARAVQQTYAVVAGTKGDMFLELEASPELTQTACAQACVGFGHIRDLCGDTPIVIMDTFGDSKGQPLPDFARGITELGIPRIEAYLPLANYREEYAITAIDLHPNARGHEEFATTLFEWMHAHVLAD